MSQRQFTQREIAQAQYNQAKRERTMDQCNHERRTFRLDEPVRGIPATITCDDCGFSLYGKAAKDARDAGLATTEETRKALPSGQ